MQEEVGTIKKMQKMGGTEDSSAAERLPPRRYKRNLIETDVPPHRGRGNCNKGSDGIRREEARRFWSEEEPRTKLCLDRKKRQKKRG